jgi:hypothetical protein
MFIHIFGFRWRAAAKDADKARARKEILAFREAIPGLVSVKVGPNLSPRSQGYEFVGVMTFTNREAAEAYATHPTHLALLDWLVGLIEAVELDLEG